MKTHDDLFGPVQNQQAQPDILQRKIMVFVDASQEVLPIQESSATCDIYYQCGFACGHDLIVKSLFGLDQYRVRTWQNIYACYRKECTDVCDLCHEIVCTRGRANGYRIDYDGKTRWYCPTCYEVMRKEILRKNFWAGFKRGFFGRRK